MAFEIVRVTRENVSLLPERQEPFDLIGRLIPAFDGATWRLSEELFEKPSRKTYPLEDYDPMEYVDNPKQAAFVAVDGGAWVGSVRVCTRWNHNAFIDDISVARNYRGQGIGTRLMDAAIQWGRETGLNGVSLETQDNNLLACRFYLKYGFELGGLDQRVYTAKEYRRETALYFYRTSIDGAFTEP